MKTRLPTIAAIVAARMIRRFQFSLRLAFLVVLLVAALLALWVKETDPIYRRARQRHHSMTNLSR